MKGGNINESKKIGSFLKELRKEMGITQEEFAEKLDVSSRTISRWETGTNMPDISLLVNIAEIFNVSISEIINGERKSEIMKKEVKKVVEAMSDYATAEKAIVLKRVKAASSKGLAALIIGLIMESICYDSMIPIFSMGENPLLIKERLGHKKIQTTPKCYHPVLTS